jgi:putative membrane protein
MHVGHRYKLFQTLDWSRNDIILPFIWAAIVAALYELVDFTFLAIPTLPVSLVGVGVAFYLGFKNKSSYDRLWEARKIWGGIVNASRSWAYGARDLLSTQHGGDATEAELDELSKELVLRHVAWLDALRHQLRKIKTWEHCGTQYDSMRDWAKVAERTEDLKEVLGPHLGEAERDEVLAMINPAAHLIARQSSRLAELRARGLVDGFAHMHLQDLLTELMTQQGKAERIKNFPLPRQYATVNFFFAVLFAILLPFALLPEFAKLGSHMAWLTVPFSTIVSWVFLCTDRIGEWSENPFEGLANDVPITSMARGIERDVKQIVGVTDLPPPREIVFNIQL